MKRIILISFLMTLNNYSQAETNPETENRDSFPGVDMIDYHSSNDDLNLINGVTKMSFIPKIVIPEQRPFYNHCFKFSSGMSLNTLRMDKSMSIYNDTSEHQFVINGHSPIMTFTHEMALDSSFGLSYTLGFSNSDIYFDNKYFGTKLFFVSINPQLFLTRRYNFEYYIKLRIGVAYYDNRLDQIPSAILRRIYPTKFQVFTGFTIAGINYLISDHFALNAELSIWSPETLNFGLTYRFMDQRKVKRGPEIRKSIYG